MTEHSPELNELAGALASAQAEFVAIPKTDNNPFFKSKYAGLPKVVQTASPILTKHGLSVSQHLGHDDGGDTLATWLLHRSGQFICDTMRLHSSPAKGLSEVQGQGSATTYSRRYAYMAVLGLVADDDDDGQAAPKRDAPDSGFLPDESVDQVLDAIKRVAMGTEWVRSQLIAVGAQDVPEGGLTRGTIQQLTSDQAVQMVKACDEARY